MTFGGTFSGINFDSSIIEWMSKWLLFHANSAIVLDISWREQVNIHWDYDETRFVLDQHTYLDLHSARSLGPQSVNRHVAPLGHIIMIPSQPVFAVSP
jgi:hypothetical protein